jgi:hypothetical protein
MKEKHKRRKEKNENFKKRKTFDISESKKFKKR